MGEDTKISWARHTFNAWIGCTKVSDACSGCYAESMAKRYGWAKWGPGEVRKRTSVANWRKPLQWDAAARQAARRDTVFSNSLSDWADPEITDEWRIDQAKLIDKTTNLDWLLLTKRHATALDMLRRCAYPKTKIRIGFTVEEPKMASVRLPKLQEIADAGWKTFVSYGPSLGPIDWLPWLKSGAIGWLVDEGESGSQARPAHPDWYRAARDACAATGIPYHHKQNGEWAELGQVGADEWRKTREQDGVIYGQLRRSGELLFDGREFPTRYPFDERREDGTGSIGPCMVRVGLERAGAKLDGREHREFPT